MNTNYLVIFPVVLPLGGAAIALLLRRWHWGQKAWSFAIMLAALASSLALLSSVWLGNGPAIYQLGGWPAPFGISLVGDMLAAMLVVMTHLVMSGGMLYALGAGDKVVQYPTFYPLFLTLVAGLTGALLTGDLFNLFVFAELLVISGAALTAISDDRYGTEAAYKYFYISLFAAVFLLIGIGSLYAAYGTLNMADLAQRIALDPDQPLLPVAIVFLLATFMVKSAVFPFHFWQPDFHSASPTPVSAMLSSVVVKLGVYGFIRMTTLLFVGQAESIQAILLVLGVVGVIFGGLAAIGAHNVKRLLAYSTLGQVGFILVAIGWGTPAALVGAIIYAFNHSLIKSAMLMLAGFVASRAPVKTAAFSGITGLGKSLPFAGVLFLVGGLGLAGIPPTNGFISKLTLFQSGLGASAFVSLAIIGAASLLTLIYVARAFQKIWWEPAGELVKAKPHGDRLLAPALLIGLCLLLGVWGEPLLQLAFATGDWLNSPANYVQAVLNP